MNAPGSTQAVSSSGVRRTPGLAVTERRVTRSEFIKLRTVRSLVVGLTASAVAMVALGTIFSYVAKGVSDSGPPGTYGDSVTTSLGGMLLVQLVIAVLGVLSVGSEYTSGMIRATFAAVPWRTRVLRAKIVVFAASVFVLIGVAGVVAFFAGNAVYGGPSVATYSLTDPGVLRALVGAGVYAAGVGVIGVALGFILRSTAAAIGVVAALLLIAPLVVQLVPGSTGDWISKILPSNAGGTMMEVTTKAGELSTWTGLAVFGAWLLAFVVAAAVVLRRRDV